MRGRYLLAGLAILVGAIALYFASRPSPPALPAAKAPVGKVVATFENRYLCTAYYTPRETGFTQAGGFNLTPETRPGLDGRKFPRDFLRAVELEGFGRMASPAGANAYLGHSDGKWFFAPIPVTCGGEPLTPMLSCAVSQKQSDLPRYALLTLQGADLPASVTNVQWVVADTGSGLEPRQIDLYLGEDNPLGPGERVSRPAGAPFHRHEKVTVIVRQ